MVENHDLGRTVPPDDVDALAATLAELIDNPEQRRAYGERAQALAATYTWEQVASPLLDYCRAPRRTAARTSQPAAITSGDAALHNALGQLDALWQLSPQPLTSGLPMIGQAKELANSLARWYIQGIVEQQNRFNAAVVHTLHALAARSDAHEDSVRWENRAVWQGLADIHASLAALDDADTALATRLANTVSGEDTRHET